MARPTLARRLDGTRRRSRNSQRPHLCAPYLALLSQAGTTARSTLETPRVSRRGRGAFPRDSWRPQRHTRVACIQATRLSLFGRREAAPCSSPRHVAQCGGPSRPWTSPYRSLLRNATSPLRASGSSRHPRFGPLRVVRGPRGRFQIAALTRPLTNRVRFPSLRHHLSTDPRSPFPTLLQKTTNTGHVIH